jgi:hypothetical protein
MIGDMWLQNEDLKLQVGQAIQENRTMTKSIDAMRAELNCLANKYYDDHPTMAAITQFEKDNPAHALGITLPLRTRRQTFNFGLYMEDPPQRMLFVSSTIIFNNHCILSGI